ncbi:MAG: hypothetical protein A3G05_00455 [Candidatus Zambryskibacteria bacterium RIFCSPLOWO2_12_FULL_45_14]|uniref:Uncharacterized protein n=2 Tax=Candidatus Zambryskiibacteriota TaxID=1817925 RepID=A0A1G2UPZ8_9BACT|nr:MAG: hypothetical protein A3H60_02455 [Candidatus Zambryskibacteria bacterium RIFCSPLOWO2_02_FULL_44_12b]OHB13374.1 MAG: hypothetical protein A3G05_00455 [Candidatus Zambryskibacteria bacterium RIFCSPLOWO2_12_FULL_45_14]
MGAAGWRKSTSTGSIFGPSPSNRESELVKFGEVLISSWRKIIPSQAPHGEGVETRRQASSS